MVYAAKLLAPLLLCFLIIAKPATAFDLGENFINEQVIAGLDEPDSLQFSPDGRMFISERVTGKLRVAIYDESTNGWQLNAQPFYTFETPKDASGNPEAHRSAGLRDIAFDPNFGSNGYIYAFYMHGSDMHNRVVRLKASSSNPDVADGTFGEELLLRMPFNSQISSGSHNGGALQFGSDGMLYISTGDGWEGDFPGDPVQSLSTFTGKIFRIHPDGSIPTSNPFYNQTSGDLRAIFALGLRNPYSMAKHPQTGVIYINEARGPNKADIYILEAGANYRHEGANSGIGTNRQPWANASAAGGQLITGGAWYPSNGTFPTQYSGVYFAALWGGNGDAKGKISYIQSNSNTAVAIFEDQVGVQDNNQLALKPVMPQVGPEGDLYYLLTTYLTNQGNVRRIRWTSQQTVQTPIISPPGGNYESAQSISMTTGTGGAEIRYTTDAAEPSLNSALYTGIFTLNSSSVVKAKAFKAGLNPSGTASESYTIGTVNNVPPNVNAGPDQTVSVGDTVTLDGSASTDPDGNDDLLFGEQWTQLSGPPVSIIDDTEEIAFFTPTAAGVYEFQLEMTDGVDTGSDEVVITAVDPPSGECGGNILSNPGFENGTSAWSFFSANGGSATTVTPAYSGSSSAKITVNNSSNNIQFYQSNLLLQPNTDYRLLFAAKSTAGRNLQVTLLEHDDDFTNYGLSNTEVDIGSSWNIHSLDFTTSGFGSPVSDGRFRFWMANHAQAGDLYWIDDVCLTELVSAPPPPPGDANLIAPLGTITTAMPQFHWNAAANATDYTLVVYDVGAGVIVFSESYSSTICSEGVCTVQPELSLAAGEYTWLVRPENEGTPGSWSTYSGQ